MLFFIFIKNYPIFDTGGDLIYPIEKEIFYN